MKSYEYQPIREVVTGLCAACIVGGWVSYFAHLDKDLCAGLLETALILIIAAEAYARD